MEEKVVKWFEEMWKILTETLGERDETPIVNHSPNFLYINKVISGYPILFQYYHSKYHDVNSYAVMNFHDNAGYVRVRYHIGKIIYYKAGGEIFHEKINYDDLEIFKKENILKYLDDTCFVTHSMSTEYYPEYREIFEGLVKNSIRRSKLKKITELLYIQ